MNPSDDRLLIANQLSCVRGDRQLFKNLSFSVSPSEVLQVSGANGAGKSSLLRIVAGLLLPTLGEIIGKTPIFYLGHQLALKQAFTVEENLLFDMRYQKPNLKKMQSILSEAGLLSLQKTMTGDLSQGQQQRLALVKCLLSTARIWVLDEPFSALDAGSRDFWHQKLKCHLEKGGAIIMSSHMPITLPTVKQKRLEL